MRPHEKASICSSIVKTLFKRNAFADLSSVYLAGTKATGANSNGLVFTVDDSADLSDISLPSSACFTVRVRNVVTECNTLVAVHAFCHIYTPPILNFVYKK